MIGTTIGNYVVRKKIGEGGMGAVYLAEHARLGRRVAVKVLLPHLGQSAQIVARFFNEAKAATDIKNEHIVDVLDFGELPDGTSYIVMEWLEGQSLADALRDGRLSVARTTHIAEGLGKALTAAHARGIVHRDLKPDNVFLVMRDGDPDFVKVLDFGIAKLTLSNAGDVRTQTGAIMGTPLYMSPEQIKGANVDQRTDIYAMGIILYQMLAGTLPFDTTTLTDLLIAHATRTPPPLRAHDPSIPAAVEGAVMRALEKDPARRFGSVDELVRALTSVGPAPVSAFASTGVAVNAFVAPPPTTAATFSKSPASASWVLPIVLLGGGGVLVAAVVLAVVLRASPASSSQPTLPDAIASTAASPVASDETSALAPLVTLDVAPSTSAPPAPPTSASTSTTKRWTLATTDCPPGTMPASVDTTRTGNAIVSRARGFPDSVGAASSDGKSFRVHNELGTCVGTAAEHVVTETCTNNLHMSCHATYTRAD
jgi:serine/threonine-protein kinase